MRTSRTKRGAALVLTAVAAAAAMATVASPAFAEPNPCAGRNGDQGTGGDYNRGLTPNHEWSIQQIYGTWYNCGGPAGQADRVRLVISTDTDGPCITVPYGSTGSSTETRQFKVIAPHYDGWKRC
jgi:hypothetical protein